MKTFKWWTSSKLKGSDYEKHFISKSSEFKRYIPNMYLLNRAALKIQHCWVKAMMRKNLVPDLEMNCETIERTIERMEDLGQSPSLMDTSISPSKRERRTRQNRINSSADKNSAKVQTKKTDSHSFILPTDQVKRDTSNVPSQRDSQRPQTTRPSSAINN